MNDIKNKKESISQATVFFSHYFKFLLVLIMAIILVGGYFLLVGPKYQEYREVSQVELNDKIKLYDALENNLADLKVLNKNYDDLSRYDFDRLDMVLPKEQDLPGLFVQIAALAEENGFTLMNIDFTDQSIKNNGKTASTLDNKIKKLSINIVLRGKGYTDLIRFLDAMEYNIRLIDVNSLNFSPGQPNYNVALTTYYLAD